MAKLLLVLAAASALLASVALAAPQAPAPAAPAPAAQPLGDLAPQRERALGYLLKNVSPPDTLPGTVVAGLSRVDPPYFFHWIRDGALVMRALVDEYANPSTAPDRVAFLEKTLWDFVKLTQIQQAKRSPSADERFNDPNGITEPKYEVDGRPYEGPWGRPQDDGPPLRALTLIDFSLEYIRRTGDRQRVENEIYRPQLPATSPLKMDLEVTAYTAGKRVCFELWEEVRGRTIHTLLVQYRALVAGAKFAKEVIPDAGAGEFYALKAKELRESQLGRFFDGQRGYVVATLDREGSLDTKVSNLDSSTILAVNHADPMATRVSTGFDLSTEPEYLPTDPRILATALAVKNAHRSTFKVNERVRPELPPAIGRYTEDSYFGGNPWFLTTFGVAEHHFRAAMRYCAAKSITVEPLSAPFWNDVLEGQQPPIAPGTYAAGSPDYARLLKALRVRADGYIQRGQVHEGPDGRLDEQLDRNTGFMISAKDLTWSYASYVTMVRARERAQETCAGAF